MLMTSFFCLLPLVKSDRASLRILVFFDQPQPILCMWCSSVLMTSFFCLLPLAPSDWASLVSFKSSERSPRGESSRLRLWNNNFVSQDKPSSLPFKVFHWHTQHLSLVQQFDTFNFAPPFLDEDLWFGKSHGQIKMDDAWNQMEFFQHLQESLM